MLSALVTTFLYSEEDSCCAMASLRLRIVSMSDWSMNCHIFSTLRDLEDEEHRTCPGCRVLHGVAPLGALGRHGGHGQRGLEVRVALGVTVGAAHVSGEETEVVQREDLQEGPDGCMSITAEIPFVHFVLLRIENAEVFFFSLEKWRRLQLLPMNRLLIVA
ncbi:hypothetical protein EYF80_043452 [Liparis tanakae]|uniref:Uncharacterized protein n=1 Tax=Liparis tanakae TaxID=230148 RepID=A0A4Z2G0K6_9TELE|nr:hypothetical protein EYF80_043452 [Liparis tanakae]